MKHFLFKDRDGQTPLPLELQAGLLPKHIQSLGELDEYEERNISLGLSWLEKQSSDGLNHLFWRKLHRRLFGDVWEWAGRVRKTELANPDFLAPHQIETALKQLEGDIGYWLREVRMEFEEATARFHERLLTIHPFPNGNGRFARILTSYICLRQGKPEPRWGLSISDPRARRKAYIEAVVQARKEQRFGPLAHFLFSKSSS